MPEVYKYTEFTTSSGKTVSIRPRYYNEWETQELSRLDSMRTIKERSDAKDSEGANLEWALSLQSSRNAQLNSWIKDFDTVKSSLTLRDIAEIEEACDKLEKIEIPLGNSNAGITVQ
jgi:hypothetical protein